VARVQSPGKMPGWVFGVAGGRCLRSAPRSMPGRRRAADPARRRRWLHRLLELCLVAAVVGWPTMLAGAAVAGDPPAPTGLSAAAAGSSQISLTWTAPPPDTSLSEYRIYAGTSSGEESLAGSSSATNGAHYTVTGLTSGTTYYFEVSAVYHVCVDSPCSDLESARSNEASSTTGFSVPGAPTGLTATAAGNSQISLTWTAPTAAAGASVTGYKVYAGTSPGGESLAGSSSATSDTVTGLSSGATYYFAVTAVYQRCIDRPCQDVESPRSNEAHATTDRTVIHGLKSQVIHFGPLAAHVAGVRFTVSASASSGLSVSFSSARPRVCSVAGSQVTTLRRGRCTITATQAGNADYSPAPDQTRSFRVKRAKGHLRSQTITFARPADVAVRQPGKLSASASSGLPVSLHSDTPGVCSVAGTQVTTLNRGTCTITATQAGNTHYAPAPDQTRSFQVGPVTPWAPRALVIALAALILAAAAGTVLVRHWLRIHRPNIQVKPHPDAHGAVRMRVTGTDVTGTVRIEPHPAQVSSQLERAQP
jgi:cytoskeletal protein RodZ